MRVAGTAIICIVAAFGAAFLVGRAVKHPAPAKAATPRTTRVADTATTPTTHPHASAELVSQFTSVRASLKRRPRPHHRHKPKPKPARVVTAAAPVVSPTTTTSAAPVTSTPVTSAPVYHVPAPTSSGSTTHRKKSSGGSGTTTIGG